MSGAPYIISAKDLQRIQNSVKDGPSVSPASIKSHKRAELKKLSDARLKNWPNTLEALRIKKGILFLKLNYCNGNKKKLNNIIVL